MISKIQACETSFRGNLLEKYKKEEKPSQPFGSRKAFKTGYNESFDEFNKSVAALETHMKTKPWKVRTGVTLLSKTLFWGFVTNMKF